MILDEYGLNFIEIPFSGSELFVSEFDINNQDVVKSENLSSAIEYHNLAIV